MTSVVGSDLDIRPHGTESVAGISPLPSTNRDEERRSGITRIKGVCGGDPCVEGTRVTVWVLYRAKSRGVSDDELLERYPFLRKRDLENAWIYAKEHHSEIEKAIRDNDVW